MMYCSMWLCKAMCKPYCLRYSCGVTRSDDGGQVLVRDTLEACCVDVVEWHHDCLVRRQRCAHLYI